MNNGITIKRILEYGDIFDDEPLSIDSYLSGISKGTLLHIASHFLGFKNHGSEFSDNYTFLNFFFNKDNREFADLVYDKIQKIEEKGSEDAVIVFHVTSLEFAECILTLGDDCKSDFKSNSEIEICVFKVYLSLNTQFTNNRHRAYRSAIGPKDDNLIARVLLAVMFNYDDLINYDLYKVFTCQFIRSVYFFEMLNSDERTTHLHNKFLIEFDCSDWKQFLKKLMPLVSPSISNKQESSTDIIVDIKDINAINFIEKMVSAPIEINDCTDFKNLRQSPVYKVEEGRYRIIFKLFLIEKLYKNIYFLLRKINELSANSLKIKDLKSFFSREFSEKYLFYKIIDNIYPYSCIKLSGESIKSEYGIDSEPDYYIRNGNKIILFESKDILINAEVKASNDYPTIEKELKKKLYFSNGKKSAVLQLIYNVENILKMKLPFDQRYRAKNIRIYPILVMHDRIFNVPGLQKLVSSWFKTELDKLRLRELDVSIVKPLVIIDIDSLIYFQDCFKDKQVDLTEILDNYYSYLKKTPDRPIIANGSFTSISGASSEPFISYLNRKLPKERRLPRMFHMLGLKLFD